MRRSQTVGPRTRGAAVAVWKLWTVTWLALHFGLTVLYVSPSNPIRERLEPLLRVTIGSEFFAQNWSLFAPRPISSDHVVLVRPLTAADRRAADRGVLPDSGWYDISTPYWEAYQRNRFTPYDRLIRAQTSAAKMYVAGTERTSRQRADCFEKKSREACARYVRGMTAARRHSGAVLRQVASALANEVDRATGSRHPHVAVRLRFVLPVSWDQRYAGRPRRRLDYNVAVYAVDPAATSPGLYHLPRAGAALASADARRAAVTRPNTRPLPTLVP